MLTIMVKMLGCAAIGIAALLPLAEAHASTSPLTRTQAIQHLTLRAFRRNLPTSVIAQTAAAETILHRFSGSPADGNNPAGGLNGDAAGALYGVTEYGGKCAYNAGGCGGTLFEIAPSTKGYYERFVYSFPATKTDAVSPFGAPIVDSSGRLFGSSDSGGAYGYGAVYQFTPSGSGFKERVLYSFKGGTEWFHIRGGANVRCGRIDLRHDFRRRGRQLQGRIVRRLRNDFQARTIRLGIRRAGVVPLQRLVKRRYVSERQAHRRE